MAKAQDEGRATQRCGSAIFRDAGGPDQEPRTPRPRRRRARAARTDRNASCPNGSMPSSGSSREAHAQQRDAGQQHHDVPGVRRATPCACGRAARQCVHGPVGALRSSRRGDSSTPRGQPSGALPAARHAIKGRGAGACGALLLLRGGAPGSWRQLLYGGHLHRAADLSKVRGRTQRQRRHAPPPPRPRRRLRWPRRGRGGAPLGPSGRMRGEAARDWRLRMRCTTLGQQHAPLLRLLRLLCLLRILLPPSPPRHPISARHSHPPRRWSRRARCARPPSPRRSAPPLPKRGGSMVSTTRPLAGRWSADFACDRTERNPRARRRRCCCFRTAATASTSPGSAIAARACRADHGRHHRSRPASVRVLREEARRAAAAQRRPVTRRLAMSSRRSSRWAT